jgi:hypothetical protein
MKLRFSAIAVLFSGLLPLIACAELPGDHPGYLHALSDLHTARWNLQHRPGEAPVSTQEDIAISEIDRAIGEARKAARDDAKDINSHPGEDANLDHPGRLHHAIELLEKAHDDLAQEEDNPVARSIKRRAIDHVDKALTATRQAVHDFEHSHSN